LHGKVTEQDLWGRTRSTFCQFLQLKRPIKVVIDASNGMAGKMVPAIFGGFGKLTIVPLLLEITDRSPTTLIPLVEENLAMLKKKWPRKFAIWGSALTAMPIGAFFWNENGNTIGCDLITALLARDFLKMPQNKGATIVYDLRSSHVVADEVKAAGGVPRRDRWGHAFIKKTMAETQAVFGGELSGHFYFRDNFYADSGAIAFARVMSVSANSPSR